VGSSHRSFNSVPSGLVGQPSVPRVVSPRNPRRGIHCRLLGSPKTRLDSGRQIRLKAGLAYLARRRRCGAAATLGKSSASTAVGAAITRGLPSARMVHPRASRDLPALAPALQGSRATIHFSWSNTCPNVVGEPPYVSVDSALFCRASAPRLLPVQSAAGQGGGLARSQGNAGHLAGPDRPASSMPESLDVMFLRAKAWDESHLSASPCTARAPRHNPAVAHGELEVEHRPASRRHRH
jgi:hypothetical protein